MTNSEETSCPNDAQLRNFLEGALSQEQTEQIRLHLLECANCRDWLGAIQKAKFAQKKAARAAATLPMTYWLLPLVVIGAIWGISHYLQQAVAKEKEEVLEKRPWAPPESVRLLPVQEIQPGRIYPIYHTGDCLLVESTITKGGYHFIYYVKANGELLRVFPDSSKANALPNPIPAGKGPWIFPTGYAENCLTLDDTQGLEFFLFVLLQKNIPLEEFAAFEQKLSDIVKSGELGHDVRYELDILVAAISTDSYVMPFEHQP